MIPEPLNDIYRNFLKNTEAEKNAGPGPAGVILAGVVAWYGALAFVALHFIVKYW